MGALRKARNTPDYKSSAGVNLIKRSGGSFFREGGPAIEGTPKWIAKRFTVQDFIDKLACSAEYESPVQNFIDNLNPPVWNATPADFFVFVTFVTSEMTAFIYQIFSGSV